jgi:hypothetical protein
MTAQTIEQLLATARRLEALLAGHPAPAAASGPRGARAQPRAAPARLG